MDMYMSSSFVCLPPLVIYGLRSVLPRPVLSITGAAALALLAAPPLSTPGVIRAVFFFSSVRRHAHDQVEPSTCVVALVTRGLCARAPVSLLQLASCVRRRAVDAMWPAAAAYASLVQKQ